MRILILGGTGFVGRHLTEIALSAGHEVTLFNRRRSGPDLFPQVESLVGDRAGDLSALAGREWDAAFDIASYFPRVTRLSCEVLKDSVGHYTLVSTMALYADYTKVGLTEDDAVIELSDPTTEEVTPRTYGGLKALCERVVVEYFPGRNLLLRPGIIIGAYDNTDRFTYWVKRIAAGGRVLTPDCWDQPIQYIDARDVMEFGLRGAEQGLSGVYNCTGPASPVPLGTLFETLNAGLGNHAEFLRAPAAPLAKALSRPGEQLPFWMPQAERRGFLQIDSRRAQTAGLTYRPLADSIQPTLDWARSLPVDHKWQAGLAADLEQQLLTRLDPAA